MSEPVPCHFQHPAIASLDRPVFRLTEGDRVPALAMSLDGSEAVIPLQAVAKLFDISPDTEDGLMLQMIGQSLRFVTLLRLGDPLPAEVLTGEASWQPAAYHRQVASARLQLQLVNWIGGGSDGQQITSQMLVVSVEDPAIRPRVQEALRRAADELGVAGGGPAVAALIEELAGELSYIEALRERLLARVQGLTRQVARLGQDGKPLPRARRETALQVNRLVSVGQSRIAARFEQVDQQTSDILSALRNLEEQRSFLRPNRDWLYSTQIAWEPILQEWDLGPTQVDPERIWRLVDRLYRFLAPRYMAVQEWQHVIATTTAAERGRVFTW